MVQVILSTGSNQGDRIQWLDLAAREVSNRIGTITIASPLVESAPWGYHSDHWFLNQILVAETALSAEEILSEIQTIEVSSGRIRTGHYADRQVDVDILFYNDLVLQRNDLTIPHPYIEERLFVLLPLAQILPDLVHPVNGKSVKRLLEECADTGVCRWYGLDN